MQSATYTIGHPQRDGRRYVRFDFVLDTGERVIVERSPFDDTSPAVLDALATTIGADIERARAEGEAEVLLGDPA